MTMYLKQSTGSCLREFRIRFEKYWLQSREYSLTIYYSVLPMQRERFSNISICLKYFWQWEHSFLSLGWLGQRREWIKLSSVCRLRSTPPDPQHLSRGTRGAPTSPLMISSRGRMMMLSNSVLQTFCFHYKECDKSKKIPIKSLIQKKSLKITCYHKTLNSLQSKRKKTFYTNI